MILLSFDTEEFDVPREHKVKFDTLKEGMEISSYGTNRILDCLKECGVHATFFCTSNFATHDPKTMQRILAEGHEVAAHGCDHWEPKPEDVANSKRILEDIIANIRNEEGEPFQTKILGYRQPRMFPVSDENIEKQGYIYNASLNPAFIPGRYMHLTTPRTYFWRKTNNTEKGSNGVLQIPASVSPILRIPMFWLSLHNFPLWLYKKLCLYITKHDGYFNTYFHPWEFYSLGEHPELKMPFIIRNNAGENMYNRLKEVILYMKSHGEEFETYGEFATKIKQSAQ